MGSGKWEVGSGRLVLELVGGGILASTISGIGERWTIKIGERCYPPPGVSQSC